MPINGDLAGIDATQWGVEVVCAGGPDSDERRRSQSVPDVLRQRRGRRVDVLQSVQTYARKSSYTAHMITRVLCIRYRTARVVKRARGLSLFHSRKCGIVLEPRSDSLNYEGHPKSFRPRHIRQQYFPQSIHQWNVHSLWTLRSQLRVGHHCNLWRHRALKRTDFQRPRKKLDSFIIMDSGHHHYQISDFKTDNSHWR